ncbi:hypothetical protein SEPCBS119000_005461 [Sporothrix epigloea]|uniref:Enoyl reductase (ER) domain-containing protein n=1 Tax=Sporothrix epigloea TaxID=1892477 RepID=A0ABP0DXZ7_9PEZI
MPLSLIVEKTAGKPGQVYYPLKLKEVHKPTAGPGELLIRIRAAALNHRDVFIRQSLYPGISFENPLFSDGCGVVEAVGADCKRCDVAQVGAVVVLAPCRNWIEDPDGPEDHNSFAILGGSLGVDAGTGSEYLCVPEDELELAPLHLSPTEAAAMPLVGLTAWRALVTKSNVTKTAQPAGGRNVLVTGIGGGVAIAAAQLAIAHGCRVYVTSGDPAKLQRAQEELGVAGGVSYKDDGWDKQLLSMLPRERPQFDAIIDGAGGDIVKRAVRLLRPGGVISSYGMTVSPKMDWLMAAVLRNIELKGSTMGSRAEFRAMVAFVREHKIRPVVSRVVYGGLSEANLPAVDSLFDDIKAGRQFGKVVLSFDKEDAASGRESPSKL